MHVHDSALQALLVFAMVLVIGTAWRIASMHLADSPLGQAMALAY